MADAAVTNGNKSSASGLKASELRYRRLFETAKDGILLLDAETGEITDVNPFLAGLLGYTHTELMGKKRWEISLPEDVAASREAFHTVQRDGYSRYENLPLQAKDGHLVDVEVVSNIYLADGKKVIQCNIRDISARKQTEQLLLDTVAYAQSIVETVREPLVILSQDLRVRTASRAFYQAFGVHPAETESQLLYDLGNGQWNIPRLRTLLEEILPQNNQFNDFEVEHTFDGIGHRIMLLNARRIHLHGNQSELILLAIEDITDRKLAEAALLRANAYNRSLIEASVDPLVTIGPEGRILDVNGATENITGVSREDLVGTDFSDYFTGPDQARAGYQRTFREGMVRDFPLELRRVDGHVTSVLYNASVYRDADGQVIGVLAAARDISERKRAEAELREARETADRANTAKSEFLSRMSHELRTPLNSILGYGQLFDDLDLSADERENIDMMMKGGRHLLCLVNEVLDVARIEAGRMTLSMEPVQVSEVIDEAVALIQPVAAKAWVTIRTENLNIARHFILADRQRLKQVFLNLLSNAVKYNRQEGTVTVTSERIGKDGGDLRVSVRDTGPGLSPELQARLFIPFDRLNADATQIEGTGLGLTLSRRLVEIMGGSIGMSSVPGDGCVFWVQFPVIDPPGDGVNPPPREGAAPSSAPERRERMRVLYIEDNLANYRLIAKIAEQRGGIELIPAMQGSIGVEMALTHKPELIFLDLHLPDMPGLEVMKRIRAIPELGKIPIIVVTADATPGSTEKLKAAGADEFISKPIEVKRIRELMNEYLSPGK